MKYAYPNSMYRLIIKILKINLNKLYIYIYIIFPLDFLFDFIQLFLDGHKEILLSIILKIKC